MTDYNGHLSIGIPLQIFILVALIFAKVTPAITLVNVLFLILFTFINPLVMDLDSNTGKLREWFTITSFVFGLIGLYLNNMSIIRYSILGGALGFGLYYFTNHRGFIHSWVFAIIYGFISGIYLGNFFLIYNAFGAYTHLIGDKLYLKFV